MDMQGFLSAINQLAEEKGLSQEKVLETVEHALASAYKKEYGKKSQIIKAKIDPQTGATQFWQVKIAVDPNEIFTPEEVQEATFDKNENKKSFLIRKNICF